MKHGSIILYNTILLICNLIVNLVLALGYSIQILLLPGESYGKVFFPLVTLIIGIFSVKNFLVLMSAYITADKVGSQLGSYFFMKEYIMHKTFILFIKNEDPSLWWDFFKGFIFKNILCNSTYKTVKQEDDGVIYDK